MRLVAKVQSSNDVRWTLNPESLHAVRESWIRQAASRLLQRLSPLAEVEDRYPEIPVMPIRLDPNER